MSSPQTEFPVIRNAALIGLGAIGTLLAAKITARDPAALRIIADPDRIARYRADPPVFNGRRLDPAYAAPADPGPPADLVLVAVKSPDLAAVPPAIAPFLADRTPILPLLNGIDAQDVLGAVLGPERILHGLVYCNSAMREGRSVVQQGVAKVVFGEAINRPPSARVQAVAAFFKRFGIEHSVPEDMAKAQWRKFILNVGLNQAQALLRITNRGLQENPDALRFARTLMDEAAAVAAAKGIAGAGDVPGWGEGVIRGLPPGEKTSMRQDVEAGRTPETDLFAGTVCRLGREYGIPTPANQLVLDQLSP